MLFHNTILFSKSIWVNFTFKFVIKTIVLTILREIDKKIIMMAIIIIKIKQSYKKIT